MTSQPDIWNMKVYPGEDWSRQFVVEGANLSTAAGAVWEMQVRKRRGTALIAAPSITATYSAPDTTVTVSLTDTVTTALAAGNFHHFIRSTLSGETEYWFVGDWDVEEAVTA